MTSYHRSSAVIDCKAIRGSGFVGSLYDDFNHQVLEQCPGIPRKYSIRPCQEGKCRLIKGDSSESYNLLRTIGVHDQLRLSLWLGLGHSYRIAGVIDYAEPIDARTRFLYYSWIETEEHYTDDDLRSIQIVKTIPPATHLITGVRFGIDVIAVVQLPSDQSIATKIDDLLERLRSALSSDADLSSTFTAEESDFLDRTIKIKVYSNAPSLTALRYLSDILDRITGIKRDCPSYLHVAYSLNPIDSFYHTSIKPITSYHTIPTSMHDQLEEYVLQKRSIIRQTKIYRHKHGSGVYTVKSMELRFSVFQKSFKVENELKQEIRELAELVEKVRAGQIGIDKIENLITVEHPKKSMTNPDGWMRAMRELDAEVEQRRQSKPQRFENRQELDHEANGAVGERTIEVKSTEPSPAVYKDQHKVIVTIPPVARLKPLIEDEVIHILLLGETGVGKSTFINAFANYLAFSSLQQALESEPIVLIPVSFILASGHQFEEHVITFGDCDPSSNEQFNERGQSVTQQCRSYDFDLPHHRGRRVCLIDTPGFGDTRGVDQNDRNIEHVLRYITRRTHLHAVCFLLKPNESRLNISFRSSFDQLFSLFGSEVGPNVMFCFTSARSTFYAPGNTAPLLKKMLTTVESGSVQLKKENSFCFDNEAFRYLMAIRQKVEFSKEEERDYERSWTMSVKESNRLIDHLLRKQPFVLNPKTND